MKKKVEFLFLFCFILSIGFVFATTVTNDLHLNIQVTDSSGNIAAGTYAFVFNISNTTNDCSAANIVYSNSTTLTTDSRGIISYYLPNVTLDYTNQYYLCYYRNGTLIDTSKLAKTPYTFSAQYLNASNSSNASFFMPYNTSVFGNFDFNGGWQNNGFSISGGNIYAQTGFFYNLSSLNITNLNINGSLIPFTGFDNSFDLGNSSLRWRNIFLAGNLYNNGTIFSANNNLTIGYNYATNGSYISNTNVTYGYSLNETNWYGNATNYLKINNSRTDINITNGYFNITNQTSNVFIANNSGIFVNGSIINFNLSNIIYGYALNNTLWVANFSNFSNIYAYENNNTFRGLTNLSFVGGNVGIGTINPGAILQVVGGSGAETARIGSTSEKYISLGAGPTSTFVQIEGITTGGAETNIALNPAGVGIVGAGSYLEMGSLGVASASTLCYGAGTVVANRISTCSVSSRRYKYNITTLTSDSGLNEIMKLNPVSFNYNKNYTTGDLLNLNRSQVGFVAEEVYQIDPRLVILNTNKSSQFYTQPENVDYPKITSILTKAIQEQQQIITSQNNTINQLKIALCKLDTKNTTGMC